MSRESILSDAQRSSPDGSPLDAPRYEHASGTVIADRYTIRRGIGVGGFGDVYFAISEGGKEVALKQVRRNWEVELRGAKHCLNLKHPNLVSLFDVTRHRDGSHWIVMEYIPGHTLREVLNRHPDGLSDAEVRRWFGQVCRGVSHLHQNGLVHRDLKPGNLFDDASAVKVGDYGLSKFVSTSHRGGHTESIGTFHYMAPEVGRGIYGPGVDVYALGVVLFELVTGRVPFDGDSHHEIVVKHLTAEPDLEGVDPFYRQIIERCLRKDPATRYRDASELLTAFEAAADPSASVATPVQPSDPDGEADPIVEAQWVGDSQASLSELAGDGLPNHSPAPEPLARAVSSSWQELTQWWRSLDRSPYAKLVLMVVAVAAVLVNTHWLIPVLALFAVLYVPYYVGRNMYLHWKMQPVYVSQQRVAMQAAAAAPMTRIQWRHAMRDSIRAQHLMTRLSGLNRSVITAIFTATVLTVCAGVIGLRDDHGSAIGVARYAAIGVTAMIAAVALLAVGKSWERDEGDSVTRRLAAGGIGAGVGVAAAGVRDFLLQSKTDGLVRDINETEIPNVLYEDGGVTGAAMMVHFALLFALLRFWRSTDPLRRKRMSFFAVALAVVGEWVVHQIVPIPQPFGMAVVGATMLALQMAAPWIHPQTPPRVSSVPHGGNPGASVSVRPPGSSGDGVRTIALSGMMFFVIAGVAASSSLAFAEDAAPTTDQTDATIAEPSELSVAPLDHLTYPDDRPEWVSDFESEDRLIIVSPPSASLDEATERAEALAEAASRSRAQVVVDFVVTDAGDLRIENPQNFVSRRYSGPVMRGEDEWFEVAWELSWDPKQDSELALVATEAELRHRVAALGVLVGSSLGVAAMAGGALSVLNRRRRFEAI